jgi:hypothetical protein
MCLMLKLDKLTMNNVQALEKIYLFHLISFDLFCNYFKIAHLFMKHLDATSKHELSN